MIDVQRVDYIRVPVTDMEEANHFYGEVLGLERNPNSPAEDWVEYETGNVTLAVMTPHTHDYEFTPLPPGTIALRVPDVAEAKAKLEAAGVQVNEMWDSGVCQGPGSATRPATRSSSTTATTRTGRAEVDDEVRRRCRRRPPPRERGGRGLGRHELLAPTLLRSQTLSPLHEAVQRGELPADVARERLARIGRMSIRLLGDAVLRRRAWEMADQLGWASTYDAEYVALTQLQADAFVTLDTELARSVEGIVTTASIDALR